MAWLPARSLKRRLLAGERFLADGGIGTELMRRGIAPDSILRANIERPEVVRSVHRDYLSAGAQILTANTFGVGAGASWGRCVRAGWELAVAAAQESGTEVFVWLSLAPGDLPRETETLRALADTPRGPDALLLETNTSLSEALAATKTAGTLRPELLAVTCHFRADGQMPDGTTPEEAACALSAAGAHILGGNCGDTPEALIGVAERMRAVTRLVRVNLQRAGYDVVPAEMPLLFQPNAGLAASLPASLPANLAASLPAGLPKRDAPGDRTHPVGPEAFAEVAARLLVVGANIVGGCCGTTPAHVAAMREKGIGCSLK
jgi:5-methyltetrahydrofolate--homocysteine methyltransferase